MKYDDLDDPGNGSTYHTGRHCVEPECTNPAGTAWSPYWCAQHNIERMRRITQRLDALASRFDAKVKP